MNILQFVVNSTTELRLINAGLEGTIIFPPSVTCMSVCVYYALWTSQGHFSRLAFPIKTRTNC